MTAVWLWDRIVPVVAILATFRVGFRVGRLTERADQLTAELVTLDGRND